MAPGDEYSAGGGGKLKLKGSKVSEGRVEKKKAKKAKKKESEKQGEGDSSNTAAVGGGGGGGDVSGGGDAGDGIPEEQNGGEVVVGKTDTERKYEETRRKRLQERLKREGVKTHKERVEELNKYLSGLSEHHDMYVFDMSSPTTWYTKALAVVVVADKLAGRRSDPVEIPCLPVGGEGGIRIRVLQDLLSLGAATYTTTATLRSVQPVLRHRADSKADRRTRATFASDHQTYIQGNDGCTNILQGYDQERESDSIMDFMLFTRTKYDIQKMASNTTSKRHAYNTQGKIM